MVTKTNEKRTIYYTYLDIPFDFTKHFLFYLYKYILELLMLIGIILTIQISVHSLGLLWISIINHHLEMAASVQLQNMSNVSLHMYVNSIVLFNMYTELSQFIFLSSHTIPVKRLSS